VTDKEYEQLVQDIDRLMETQREQITDHYMQGMYNGMELIRSLVTKTTPLYIDLDGEFDPEEMLEYPERFV
jgi:hypothetical protein